MAEPIFTIMRRHGFKPVENEKTNSGTPWLKVVFRHPESPAEAQNAFRAAHRVIASELRLRKGTSAAPSGKRFFFPLGSGETVAHYFADEREKPGKITVYAMGHEAVKALRERIVEVFGPDVFAPKRGK